MIFFTKICRVACFFATLICAEAWVSEFHGSKQDINVKQRQLLEKSCDGLKVDLKPPWDFMDVWLPGTSLALCKSCATSLQNQGFLRSGWECYETVFGWTYLRRYAETDLKPVKPRHTFNLDDVADGAGPIKPGTAPLPRDLRGVFWLSNQATQSALITFASNGASDCTWCSHGDLILNRYLIRVDGDRTWSFAQESSAGYDLVRGFSVLYDFEFNHATAPTHATIYPLLQKLGSLGSKLSRQTWILNFDMTLLSPEEAEKEGFPGSVVWVRKSYILGFEVTAKRYFVIQVVNEDGARIEPAWSKFVAYQKSSEAGDEPGILYYHGGDTNAERLFEVPENKIGRFTRERASPLCVAFVACVSLAFLAAFVVRRGLRSVTGGYGQTALPLNSGCE